LPLKVSSTLLKFVPSTGVLTATGFAGNGSALTNVTATTNANLTGVVTSSGNATSLGTFTSANLLGALSDETGTGTAVFATSPTLVTPALGTPSALVGTNITGTAANLTAGNATNIGITNDVATATPVYPTWVTANTGNKPLNVSSTKISFVPSTGVLTATGFAGNGSALTNVTAATNANLTGAVTSVGNATSLGSFSSANLSGALSDETGTGLAVFATSPTLVTPALGTPSALVGTNITGTAAGLTVGLANNLTNAGAGIYSSTPGLIYSSAVCVREVAGRTGNNAADGAPRLGFHWGGVVASSISLGSDGHFYFNNNPGTGREDIYAGNINASGQFNGSGAGLTGTASNLTADGATKLWSVSHPTSYYISNTWDGTYWQLTSNHGSAVNVGHATNADNATNAGRVYASLTGTNGADLLYAQMADNDYFRLRVGGTASNAGWAEIATADDGNEPIYVSQYTGTFAALTRRATLLDESGNTSFPNTVSASQLNCPVIGTTDDRDVVFKRNGVQSGLLNLAKSNTSFGVSALNPASTGGGNVATGYNALTTNTTGYGNVATGVNALNGNTTGHDNVATGFWALNKNTSGVNNIAIGRDALGSNTTGTSNIATGNGALFSNVNGTDNVATGESALNANISGIGNVATGRNALVSNTKGSYNNAIGYGALYNNVAGSNGVAFGTSSQYYANNTTSGWTNTNTSVGYHSLMGSGTPANNTGLGNTALGYQTMQSNSSGGNNTAIGINALTANTTGSYNVATGPNTLAANTTGQGNVAAGSSVLSTNTTGDNNTAIGNIALQNNTTGSNNTATGTYALNSNVAGSSGVAIGYSSQKYANNKASAWENTNTSVGYQSLQGSTNPANNYGLNNTAIGYQSLMNNTVAYGNTALGYRSLFNTTTGYDNVALGNQTLTGNSTGNNNVAIGTMSLNYNTTGWTNIAIGTNALYNNTGGYDNVAIGSSALYNNTTGAGLTAIGVNAGNTDNSITTPDGLYNATAIGYMAQVQTSNALILGGTGSYAVNVGIGTTYPWYRLHVNGDAYVSGDLMVGGTYYNWSDVRLKTKIETLTDVLSKLDQLRGVTYEFKDQEKYAKGPQVGVIAQELQKVFPQLVKTEKDGYLSVNYTNLTAVLIQAIKEQQQEIKDQQQKVKDQQQKIDLLEKQMEKVMNKLGIQ